MTSDGNMYMPVAPVGNTGDGFFGGNGTAFWLIILLAMFGWGNGGWGGNYGGNGGGFVGADIQRGFDQSALTTGINNIQTALCNGFASVNAGMTSGFAQAEIAANNRQMADMNQQFALQSALSSCCCENRLSSADLKATILSENCSDRAALSDGIRDILVNQNSNTQRIIDQMCNDKIDAKNERIADLERQLTMANLAASQGAQTAAILANNEAQTAALERYLAPTPIPAYVVQNPNCCGSYNYGCGCGAA